MVTERLRTGHAVVAIALGFGSVAPAAEIVVEGSCSLIDAIHAANTDTMTGGCSAGAGSDSIRLTDHVELTEIADSTRGSNGLPLIESDIAIDGEGHSVTRVGPLQFRHFYIARNATLALNDISLLNGVGSSIYVADVAGSVLNYGTLRLSNTTFQANGEGNEYGGAMMNVGQLSAIDSRFIANDGFFGGGIANYGEATLVNTTFSGNFADSIGGAILNDGSLTVLDSSLALNSADRSGGAIHNGVAAYSVATAEISRTQILENAAILGQGGGIYNSPDGDLFINESVISDNTSEDDGAGVYNEGALEIRNAWIRGNRVLGPNWSGGGLLSNTAQPIQISDSTFSGNDAVTGGGMFLLGGSVTIENTTLSHNSARNNGGAMINGADLELFQVTLQGNFAEIVEGTSGLWFDGFVGSVTATRSIFGGHDNGGCGGGGLPIDLGGNFDDDGSCGPGVGFLTGLDPNLADNGGFTPTHALDAGSSAIDAIACAPTVDQRGFLRLDGQCDSGAYEVDAPPLVLEVVGACPGQLELTISGGTPNGEVSIAASRGTGLFRLPGGTCAEVDLGMRDPRLVASLTLSADGRATVSRNVPVASCGATLRVLDRSSCALSDLVVGP